MITRRSFKAILSMLAVILPLPLSIQAKHPPQLAASHTCHNNIPPRFQWDNNAGYCGEVSLISAGLYYGQYASQYDVRAIATKNALQYQNQLLLGINDLYAANQMHLNAIEWDSVGESSTDQFLAWVKQNVVNGFPVAIGIYTNEFLFYTDTDPNAGQSDYDHIVPVFGIGSNHSLTDPKYYADDILYFSDNGLWGGPQNPPYNFNFAFGPFQANRKQANAKNGSIYSLSNSGTNYGICITGIMDLNHDTVPVRLDTDLNAENPGIDDGSNTRPPPEALTLTITVSDLVPGVSYHLYRYNDFNSVPNSQFNANAGKALQHFVIQIKSGNSYAMKEQINSDEIAIYRCVKASAP